MADKSKIAIIYLSYHAEPYLSDVVSALKRLVYPRDLVEFVVVDNPHDQYGPSVRFLEEILLPLSGREIPHVTILPQNTNIGFSGGNNAGIKWALEHGFDYVYLHNNDGFLAADALDPLVNVMEGDKTIGQAQSLILLHPETDLINTTGNQLHFLGFGYCNDYKVPIKERTFPPVKDISYASGAGVMLRADLLRTYGLWEEDFFLYHEDCEYSFRLRMAGYRIVMVSGSIFYHKYQFARSIQKFYWMERNRFAILLMFFRWPTLIVLLPMLLVLEVGLWFFAWQHKWLDKRVKVYQYWWSREHIKHWLKKRAVIQRLRRISDRELLSYTSPAISFQEKSMEHPTVRFIGNPLMTLYYWVVVKGLIWW